MTQVTETQYDGQSICSINKIVRHVRKHEKRGILQQPLDRKSLHIRVYADGSFADNVDMKTQLGYIILMCDDSDR